MKAKTAGKGGKMLGLVDNVVSTPGICFKKVTYSKLPDLYGEFKQTLVTIDFSVVKDGSTDEKLLKRHFRKFHTGLLSRMRRNFQKDDAIDEYRRQLLVKDNNFWRQKCASNNQAEINGFAAGLEKQEQIIRDSLDMVKKFDHAATFRKIKLPSGGNLRLADYDSTTWSLLEMEVSASPKEALAFLWHWDSRCLVGSASDGYEAERKIEVVKNGTKQVVNTTYTLDGGATNV